MYQYIAHRGVHNIHTGKYEYAVQLDNIVFLKNKSFPSLNLVSILCVGILNVIWMDTVDPFDCLSTGTTSKI
eukprot:SAG31_NODE_9399_length_1283_cov_6.218750_1_plen_72_part_00